MAVNNYEVEGIDVDVTTGSEVDLEDELRAPLKWKNVIVPNQETGSR